jgi:hypothetical protein
MQGHWTPLSHSLETTGGMGLTATTLHWRPCGSTALQVSAKASSPNAQQALISVPAKACALDEQPFERLLLVRRAGSCDVEVTLFEHPQDVQKNEPLAAGAMTLEGCKTGR